MQRLRHDGDTDTTPEDVRRSTTHGRTSTGSVPRTHTKHLTLSLSYTRVFPQDGFRERTGTCRLGPRGRRPALPLHRLRQDPREAQCPEALYAGVVVVADGCHISNGRPEHVRLTELLAADNEEESNDEQEVNTDETVAYVNSASVTVLDASFGTEREVHTVRDSDEEVRAIARRCPMPKSWSTPRAVRRRTRAKTPP